VGGSYSLGPNAGRSVECDSARPDPALNCRASSDNLLVIFFIGQVLAVRYLVEPSGRLQVALIAAATSTGRSSSRSALPSCTLLGPATWTRLFLSCSCRYNPLLSRAVSRDQHRIADHHLVLSLCLSSSTSASSTVWPLSGMYSRLAGLSPPYRLLHALNHPPLSTGPRHWLHRGGVIPQQLGRPRQAARRRHRS